MSTADSKAYKKLRRKQSRTIRSETNDPALNKESILNVNDFLNSRKFEINELAKAQLNSKFASSSRVFQSLPRKLRRRTASHNVKRIPKRLRNRAIKEMTKNDTPVIKKRNPKGRDLYRLRMTKNLLRLASKTITSNHQLPNDVNLSLGKLKLRQRIKQLNKNIRLQKREKFIDLNNKLGSYDNTGVNALASPPLGKIKYMKRQRQFTWLNSHIWHAKRSHMIKRWGFQIPSRPTQKCFRLAHRNANLTGGICWDRSFINTLILESQAPSDIVEVLKKLLNSDKIGTRILNNGGISYKLIYKEQELLGDSEILSFRSDTTLRTIIRLHPSIYTTIFEHINSFRPSTVTLYDARYSIGSIEVGGPIALRSLATVLKTDTQDKFFSQLCCESNLPDNTIFTIMSQDPRLANRKKPSPFKNVDINELLVEMKTSKSNIKQDVLDSLLTPEGRTASYKNQLTLKEIPNAKNNLEKVASPLFPVIIYKARGLWTVLLPWYWTLPVWYQLNHIAHMNHGGLLQSHQLKFETNQLFYPDDFPFTIRGQLENKIRADLKRSKYDKKPKSKKLNYDKLKLCPDSNEYQIGELGDPFACDWRYLQVLQIALKKLPSNAPDFTRTSSWDSKLQREIKELHDVYEYIKDVAQDDKEAELREVEPVQPVVLLSKGEAPIIPATVREPVSVVPVKLEVVGKGNPTDNARIYSIPEQELPKWINASKELKTSGKKLNKYPTIPHSQNLIGFITSGSYNLSKGCNTGIGAIVATEKETKYCVVRNVGTDYGRLAKVEVIKL